MDQGAAVSVFGVRGAEVVTKERQLNPPPGRTFQFGSAEERRAEPAELFCGPRSGFERSIYPQVWGLNPPGAHPEN